MSCPFGVEYEVAKHLRPTGSDPASGKFDPAVVPDNWGRVFNKTKADQWRKQGYRVNSAVDNAGRTSYAREARYPTRQVRRGLLRRKRTTTDFTRVEYERAGVAKSEYLPGEFEPITQMSARKRRATRARVTNPPKTPTTGGARDLVGTLANHGIGRSPSTLLEFHDAATPSAVHRNVHFARSVPTAHRAEIDRHLDPELTRKLRHPVVFHHEEKFVGNENVKAAALGGHRGLTGGRGHVAYTDSALQAPVLNHELVHASVRNTPMVGTHRGPAAAAGEEARADAGSGHNLYTEHGQIARGHQLRAFRHMRPARARQAVSELVEARPALQHHPATRMDVQGQLAAQAQHLRYHQVQRAVRLGRLAKSAFGVEHINQPPCVMIEQGRLP